MKSRVEIFDDGIYFISNNGIVYDLIEGKSMNASSDIVFILLSSISDYDIKTEDRYVGYLYGALDFIEDIKEKNDIRDFISLLDLIVEEFEEKNNIYKGYYSKVNRARYHRYYNLRNYEYLVDFEKSDAMYNYLKQHGIENDGGYVFAESMRYCVKTNKIHDSIIRREFAFA